MNNNNQTEQLHPPCIIESGTIVNKDDIRRLLNDLHRVRYIHFIDGEVQNQGEGQIIEVFSDSYQATIIANHNLYLNIQSFDYLYLQQSSELETYFDLIQDNRKLRLIPSSHCLQPNNLGDENIDVATLEAMLTQVLSAKWDVQFDEDDDSPFQ